MSEQHETTTTAVSEAQGPGTKDMLAQQLAARQSQVHQAQERHRELEGLAIERGLTLPEVQEQLGLERWIALEQVHLERLQTEMQRARIAFDLEAAVQHHDSFIEAKQQCYGQIAEAIQGLYQAFQHLAAVDREQKAPLLKLTSPSGRPFTVIGHEELVANVVSRMPDAASWSAVLGAQALSIKDVESMMDVDSGLRPISERMMERFLRGERA